MPFEEFRGVSRSEDCGRRTVEDDAPGVRRHATVSRNSAGLRMISQDLAGSRRISPDLAGSGGNRDGTFKGFSAAR
jgi:hypothetical protein